MEKPVHDMSHRHCTPYISSVSNEPWNWTEMKNCRNYICYGIPTLDGGGGTRVTFFNKIPQTAWSESNVPTARELTEHAERIFLPNANLIFAVPLNSKHTRQQNIPPHCRRTAYCIVLFFNSEEKGEISKDSLMKINLPETEGKKTSLV